MKKFTFLFILLCISCFAAKSDCTPLYFSESFSSEFGKFSAIDVSGTKSWSIDATYKYAKISGYQSADNEDWLVSEAIDLTGSKSATFSFEHTSNWGEVNRLAEFETLWITNNYTGNPATTTWTQLSIPTYPAGSNWNFVGSGNIKIPASFLTQNVQIGFKYATATSEESPTWEVKNVKLVSVCNEGEVILPVPLPNVGDATLKVMAQNLRNYFFNLSNSEFYERSQCKDQACFAEKTHDIVDVFLFANADIYAMNELEATNNVLAQLVDSMNIRTTNNPYAYISDNIDWNEGLIKSGFIYRKDRVKPVGSSRAASTQFVYRNTMRLQLFEDLASKQQFTVSINHFKAKDNTGTDEGKRITNANDLLSNIKNLNNVLLIGDLNCEIDEKPLQILVDAGYEEQLLKYNANAYSYCWNGGTELIDHVFANQKMAANITGAGVYHISTTCSSAANRDYRYSDHDPYLVGLRFENKGDECEELNFGESFYSTLGQFTPINMAGTNDWYCQYSYHYAVMNGTQSDNNEDWLISPAFDLSKYGSATLAFEHTANKGNAATQTTRQTVWVSNNYKSGVPIDANWTKLTIPNYPTGSDWTFVNSGNIKIPADMLKENTHFAFKYSSATAAEASQWEIRNVTLKATCRKTAVENTAAATAIVVGKRGEIVIANAPTSVDIFNISGQKIASLGGNNSLSIAAPQGVYIVRIGNEIHKVIVK